MLQLCFVHLDLSINLLVTRQELIREDEPIEVVFVSDDSSPEELLTYMRECHGDWLAVQHGANLGRWGNVSVLSLP